MHLKVKVKTELKVFDRPELSPGMRGWGVAKYESKP